MRALRALGFTGPFSGTRHQFMLYADRRLAIPSNPEYSVAQLGFMVREVEGIIGRSITLEEWRRLLTGTANGRARDDGQRPGHS